MPSPLDWYKLGGVIFVSFLGLVDGRAEAAYMNRIHRGTPLRRAQIRRHLGGRRERQQHKSRVDPVTAGRVDRSSESASGEASGRLGVGQQVTARTAPRAIP